MGAPVIANFLRTIHKIEATHSVTPVLRAEGLAIEDTARHDKSGGFFRLGRYLDDRKRSGGGRIRMTGSSYGETFRGRTKLARQLGATFRIRRYWDYRARSGGGRIRMTGSSNGETFRGRPRQRGRASFSPALEPNNLFDEAGKAPILASSNKFSIWRMVGVD